MRFYWPKSSIVCNDRAKGTRRTKVIRATCGFTFHAVVLHSSNRRHTLLHAAWRVSTKLCIAFCVYRTSAERRRKVRKIVYYSKTTASKFTVYRFVCARDDWIVLNKFNRLMSVQAHVDSNNKQWNEKHTFVRTQNQQYQRSICIRTFLDTPERFLLLCTSMIFGMGWPSLLLRMDSWYPEISFGPDMSLT